MKDGLAATGMFGEGASGTVADDAPLQVRYLDTFGRRPYGSDRAASKPALAIRRNPASTSKSTSSASVTHRMP